MRRDIRADYIREYQNEHARALTAGNHRHADRVAKILTGYGVTVQSTPLETTAGESALETTAEPKPKRSKKK